MRETAQRQTAAEIRRGRPPLTPETRPARVNLGLPPDLYDAADARAKRQGISLPEAVRQALKRDLGIS